jgi:amino acid transporter
MLLLNDIGILFDISVELTSVTSHYSMEGFKVSTMFVYFLWEINVRNKPKSQSRMGNRWFCKCRTYIVKITFFVFMLINVNTWFLSILCCVCCFVCPRSVSCAQCFLCLVPNVFCVSRLPILDWLFGLFLTFISHRKYTNIVDYIYQHENKKCYFDYICSTFAKPTVIFC